MTQKEFATFAMALKTYYPKENVLPNSQAMDLWYRQLNDIDYQVISTALDKWVATNKWSPSIADIRELSTEIAIGNLPDWSEAWEKVVKAFSFFGRNRADEAMDAFDEITRTAVHRIGGFTKLCNTENLTSDRARFAEVYTAIAQRKKKDEQVPMLVRQTIDRLMIGVNDDSRSGNETRRVPEIGSLSQV